MEKKCKYPADHDWAYEHTIYSGIEGKDTKNTVAVHRQCRKCKKHQLAKTKAWHKPHKDYGLEDIVHQ